MADTKKIIMEDTSDVKFFNAETEEEFKKHDEQKIDLDEYVKETNSVRLKSLHSLIKVITANKNIELDKTYWASEWSWNPIFDGNTMSKEHIRSKLEINGITIYFTNKNYRFYLKEDIYNTEEEAEAMSDWKNSFGYDYENYIDRANLIKGMLGNERVGNTIVWYIRKEK